MGSTQYTMFMHHSVYEWNVDFLGNQSRQLQARLSEWVHMQTENSVFESQTSTNRSIDIDFVLFYSWRARERERYNYGKNTHYARHRFQTWNSFILERIQNSNILPFAKKDIESGFCLWVLPTSMQNIPSKFGWNQFFWGCWLLAFWYNVPRTRLRDTCRPVAKIITGR